MKTEIKELWTEALESGEYTQTQKTLKDNNGHCCLGVLCDLYHKATGLGGWDTYHWFLTEEFIYDDDDNEVPKLEEEQLPLEVQEWAGLDSALGDFANENLAKLNDSGMDFKEIAQTIQENF